MADNHFNQYFLNLMSNLKVIFIIKLISKKLK